MVGGRRSLDGWTLLLRLSVGPEGTAEIEKQQARYCGQTAGPTDLSLAVRLSFHPCGGWGSPRTPC